jgi:hypothetical protein
MMTKRTVQAIHQFTVIRRFGFPDGLSCWCGERLEFKPREGNVQRKRLDFFKAHEECRPLLEKIGRMV